ncbi:Uncharacterised protein [Mycobacteroides abscessus subsp. abscessus]|nr:Uncharacterised protein [Mycobacteroides abscessus subsp. abscessus]
MSSLAAMIMSTKGRVAKNSSAGRYCSPRAARKIVLSRRPHSTYSTIGAISSRGSISPEVLSGRAALSDALGAPGARIATSRPARNATYSTTSPIVLVSPAVPGSHRHGRSRMVPGRAQNRMPPVIGLNLPASGPQDPATPTASSSTVHSTSFW